jgi:hypothetical protein
MNLTFNLIIGFILTWTGISWIVKTAYDLFWTIFNKSKINSAVILFLVGSYFLTFYGIQLLKKDLRERETSNFTCTCGRKLPPQAKFCPSCGKKIEK